MRKKPEMFPEIADKVPCADRVTVYDEAHLIDYVRLLDSAAQDGCPEEMARITLRIDLDTEPGRAKRAVESHFKRARWMSERGYLDLLSR